jgi:hypothetical protein
MSGVVKRLRILEAGSWPCCMVTPDGHLWFQDGDHEPSEWAVPGGTALVCTVCVPFRLRTAVAARLGVDRLGPVCACIRRRTPRPEAV